MKIQTTSHVLMVRPVRFGFNPQTAANNVFQSDRNGAEAQAAALREFDDYVSLLRSEGITVTVVEDTPTPHTPDSIFPNNWFSTHADGTTVLYPLFAPNRRQERKPAVLAAIRAANPGGRIIDLTGWESQERFLEGTGSMVLDRTGRTAYACLSPRTDETVLKDFAAQTGYEYFLFHAADRNGIPIYHTNVMMSVGSDFAIVCLEAVTDPRERRALTEQLESTGRKILAITLEQVAQYAGNMLELKGKSDQKLLVMSGSALRSLTAEQRHILEQAHRIIAPELACIEANGGGSARCMIAELFSANATAE